MADRPSDPVIDYALMAQRAQRAELERDALRAEVERLKQEFQVSVIQDDMHALLRACGISDHARPASCHTILHDEVIPAVERAKQAEAEVERLRKRMSGMRARAWTTIGNLINSDNHEFVSKLQEKVDEALTKVLEQEDNTNG